MGLFDDSNLAADSEPEDTAPEVEPEEIETAEDDEPEQPQLSRREAARQHAEEIEQFKTREAAQLERDRERDQQFQQTQQELARMQGMLQAQQQAQAKPEAPRTPEEIMKDGRRALEKDNDLDAYEAAIIEATKAAAAIANPKAEAPQQTQPQMDPMLQMQTTRLLGKHETLAREQNWEARVTSMVHTLKAEGTKLTGTALLEKAFAEAESRVKPAGAVRPKFNKDNAAVLAGTPHASDGTGADEGSRLSPAEKAAARDADMTEKEYIKYLKPGSESAGVKW